MFTPDDILYEDNHLMVVNKHCGDLVQPDRETDDALETEIKAMIKVRDHKAGGVFLGVVHRIDRPVSGAVLFAKTSKALTRLNDMIREGRISKSYWAITEHTPSPEQGRLVHYILRDGRTNRSRALDAPRGDAKRAELEYRVAARTPSPDPGAALEDRVSDTRRPEVRGAPLESRRRHLAPLAVCGVHAPGKP